MSEMAVLITPATTVATTTASAYPRPVEVDVEGAAVVSGAPRRNVSTFKEV